MNEPLAALAKIEPMKPRGWYHWLHFHFAARYPIHDAVAEKSPLSEALRAFEQAHSEGHLDAHLDFVSMLEKHAWLVGRLDLCPLMEKFWNDVHLQSRGMLLAGLSENLLAGIDRADWIAERLTSAQLTPDSACQLACNFIWRNRVDLLESILSDSAEWKTEIWRGDHDEYPSTHWPDVMPKLSRRVIDMVLEAALVCKRDRAVADRLAITLINRQQIGPDHFQEREGGAIEFTPVGRKAVIQAYQLRKQETLTHPVLEQNLRLAQLPFIQARILARHLRGDIPDYLPLIPK